MHIIMPPLQENFETAVQFDVLANEEQIVSAIADTWEFMTGAPMPPEVVINARRVPPEAASSVWSDALIFEALSNSRLTKIARYIKNHSNIGEQGSPVALVQEAGFIDLPAPNPFLTSLITQLGEAVLDTAYKGLGPGADIAVHEFLESAKDDMSDFEKFCLLVEKFNEAFTGTEETDHHENTENSENYFKDSEGRTVNHILKLSPYYIQKLSSEGVKPTCLSLSIMAASFFRKCGIDTMFHVGVVTPEAWPYSRCVAEIAAHIHNFASTNFVPYPDKLRQMLVKRRDSAQRLANDWDPHSALLCTIGETTILFDPYQDLNVVLMTGQQAVLADIRDLHTRHAGLEVLYNPDPSLNHYLWTDNMEISFDLLTAEDSVSPIRWKNALDYSIADASVGPLIDVIKSTWSSGRDIISLLSAGGFVEARALTGDHLSDEATKEMSVEELFVYVEQQKKKESEMLLLESLAQQIFWLKEYDENEIIKCLIRCSEDERYYQRRLEDLELWSKRLILFAAQRAWHDVRTTNIALPHLTLEVGNLEHRVGVTSLLDVSYGLGYRLPISFWATQTSSQLPWLYEQQSEAWKDESTTGQEVSKKLHRVMRLLNWRYRLITGIIYSDPE